jgi:neutral ceramidase
MHGRYLLAAFCASASLSCASAAPTPHVTPAGDLLVGVSAIDITPEEPIRLTGYGSRSEPTHDIRQRLRAKALAFSDARTGPAILITSDLIGVPRHASDELARRLASSGVRREQLALTATHTHTGPMLGGTLPFIFGAPIPAEHQAASDRYTKLLIDKLERVAREALADRRPSRVSWSRGRVGFAANRRVLRDGKWTAFGINPSGPVDHDLPMLAVHDPNGRLRALLVSYACHATTLEGRDNFVHGDWPGVAQALIEARHPGSVALIAIGAGADANPNPRGGGLPDVERHARELAGEVDRLLVAPGQRLAGAPVGRYRLIDLTFSRIPGKPEWEQLAVKSDASGFFARAMVARLARGDVIPLSTPYPIQVWTFADDLAMVFLGGEVVADYGLRLKRELDGSRLWVNAYANDVSFYVASQRMIAEGGYEVDRSMVYYGQPAPLAAQTEDEIIRAVLDLIPRAFAR